MRQVRVVAGGYAVGVVAGGLLAGLSMRQLDAAPWLQAAAVFCGSGIVLAVYLRRHQEQQELFTLAATAVGLLSVLVSLWLGLAPSGEGREPSARPVAPSIGVQVDRLRSRLHDRGLALVREMQADLHGSGTQSLLVTVRAKDAQLSAGPDGPLVSDELRIYDEQADGRLERVLAFRPRAWGQPWKGASWPTKDPAPWLARIIAIRDLDGDGVDEVIGSFASHMNLAGVSTTAPFLLRWHPARSRYRMSSLVGDPPLLADPDRLGRAARPPRPAKLDGSFTRPLVLSNAYGGSPLVTTLMSDVSVDFRLDRHVTMLPNATLVAGWYRTTDRFDVAPIAPISKFRQVRRGEYEARLWILSGSGGRIARLSCEPFPPRGKAPPYPVHPTVRHDRKERLARIVH